MILSAAEEARIGRALNLLSCPLTIHILSNQPTNSLFLATADIVDYTVSLSPATLSRTHRASPEGELDPGIIIANQQGETFGVRFTGTPSGMEYTGFIEALMAFGQPAPTDHSALGHLLTHIANPVRSKIFVSPTCTRCPGIVAMAIRFARLQPMISADIIQVDQFPAAGQAHQVLGVPTTWCEPGPYVFTGVPAPEYFAAYLIQASTPAPHPEKPACG
jgi:alkyl hydroperoxide reductase subunit AhpF